jgi:hypothetical protein
MNSLIFKEDIQQIFKSYKSDLSLNEAIRIVESHGKLNESKSISVENAFGTIVMKLYESIELNEALDPELEQIATQWAPMIKKLVDGGKDPVAKIKGAIEHLTKEGDITKEEVAPFIASLVSKTQVTDEIKKQLTSIGSASPEQKMPTSLPGVIAEVKKQVTTTKTPEEAEKKANDGIKKAGLKGKLLEYETGIYKWIGKLPLVGGWFSKRSKTQQRIIVLIAIAILSYLVYQGVKWAMKVMDEAGKNTTSGGTQGSSGKIANMAGKALSAEEFATKSQVFTQQLIDAQSRHGDIGLIVAKMAKAGFSPEQIANTLNNSGIYGDKAMDIIGQAALDNSDFSYGDIISKANDFVQK